jgi:hypothetical protein
VVTGATQVFTRLGYRLLSLGLNPDTPRLTIGIWGTRATGKTTSLAMLPIAAKSTRWAMVPSDPTTAEFLEQSQAALVGMGRFPDPLSERPPVTYSFFIQRARSYVEKVAGRRRAFEVKFLDAPGDWCERPIPARSSPDSPVEYLSACDAILFFLDPLQMRLHGSDYGADVVSVLDAVRLRLELPNDGRLPHRLAFVVPRVDEDEQWSHRGRARGYVEELVGMEAFQDIVDRCRPSRFRFFACSAVGRVDGRANCERHDGRSRIPNPEGIQPYRLFEPLAWMLESFA